MEIVIERIDHDERDCNDCNNPKDQDDIEATNTDYNEYLSRTYLDKYADLINYPYTFVHNLTPTEAGVLIDAIPSGFITGRPSSLYQDEFNTIIERLDHALEENKIITPKDGWFVRLSSCSPKDGLPLFPLKSSREIISKLATSKRTLIALLKGDRSLYFVPYDASWEEFRELRVFVRRGRVTAISQYVWYKYAFFSSLKDEELIDIAKNLVEYLNSTLPPILSQIKTDSVVVDLYYKGEDSENDENKQKKERGENDLFKIIEFNSFGYFMSAGAALFNWQTDRSKLYGMDNKTYFRVHT